MMRASSAASLVVFLAVSPCWAGDDLNAQYFKLFRQVIAEGRREAPKAFVSDPKSLEKFLGLAEKAEKALNGMIPPGSAYLKKVRKATDAKPFNDFNFALQSLAAASGTELEQLLPSYDSWNSMETDLTLEALNARIASYEVRYGPGSECLNILEFLAVQAPPFRGGLGGPKAWEPIARLTPVSLTSGASAPVSTFQGGINYYFLGGAPSWMQRFGVSNHVGVAAALQYLEPEKPLHFRGQPTFGVIFHLDRSEVGFTWTEAKKQAQITLGYAFQFVPLGL